MPPGRRQQQGSFRSMSMLAAAIVAVTAAGAAALQHCNSGPQPPSTRTSDGPTLGKRSLRAPPLPPPRDTDAAGHDEQTGSRSMPTVPAPHSLSEHLADSFAGAHVSCDVAGSSATALGTLVDCPAAEPLCHQRFRLVEGVVELAVNPGTMRSMRAITDSEQVIEFRLAEVDGDVRCVGEARHAPARWVHGTIVGLSTPDSTELEALRVVGCSSSSARVDQDASFRMPIASEQSCTLALYGADGVLLAASQLLMPSDEVEDDLTADLTIGVLDAPPDSTIHDATTTCAAQTAQAWLVAESTAALLGAESDAASTLRDVAEDIESECESPPGDQGDPRPN